MALTRVSGCMNSPPQPKRGIGDLQTVPSTQNQAEDCTGTSLKASKSRFKVSWLSVYATPEAPVGYTDNHETLNLDLEAYL